MFEEKQVRLALHSNFMWLLELMEARSYNEKQQMKKCSHTLAVSNMEYVELRVQPFDFVMSRFLMYFPSIDQQRKHKAYWIVSDIRRIVSKIDSFSSWYSKHGVGRCVTVSYFAQKNNWNNKRKIKLKSKKKHQQLVTVSYLTRDWLNGQNLRTVQFSCFQLQKSFLQNFVFTYFWIVHHHNDTHLSNEKQFLD